MPEFRPDELAQWSSAPWKNGSPAGAITGVSKDTRTLVPGDLYIALRGDAFDGHDFVAEALAKGAVGALVDVASQEPDGPFLQVPDTQVGLQNLARGYRKKWTGTVIGITGSVGKTTTKEMCADVFSAQGITHRTAGNYNNQIGLPLTMLAMPETAKQGVFEMGMNHPGEIGPLADLLHPTVGILTDIGAAHTENFPSLEAIAREKSELLDRIPASGIVILDGDSEWYELMRQQTVARVKTLSFGGNADCVGIAVAPDVMAVTHRALCIMHHEFTMPLPGEHIMRNALRAILLGLEYGLEPAEIQAGLNRFNPPPMRWQESEVNGIHFINDAYNANPLSMRANLKTFASLPGAGKKWAVVGGMRELGATAVDEHAKLGHFIDGLNLDGVITVGELGQQIVSQGAAPFFQTENPAETAQVLKDNLQVGDYVLLKASRGEQLEQVLNDFKEK